MQKNLQKMTGTVVNPEVAVAKKNKLYVRYEMYSASCSSK